MKKTVKNSGSWINHVNSYTSQDIQNFSRELIKLYPKKERCSINSRDERLEMMKRFWKE